MGFQHNNFEEAEQDILTLDIWFIYFSIGSGFPVKYRKGVSDIQLKLSRCEVVFLRIKLFKENLDCQYSFIAALWVFKAKIKKIVLDSKC